MVKSQIVVKLASVESEVNSRRHFARPPRIATALEFRSSRFILLARCVFCLMFKAMALLKIGTCHKDKVVYFDERVKRMHWHAFEE